VRTWWLSTHLPYACRHSGVCCTSRWPIPIERTRAEAVARAVAAGTLAAPGRWYRPDADAPAGVAGVLALQASGACVFHRAPAANAGGGCAIHDARPAACAHFPYVCVIDPRGVHVTLSHYCPTAADLLFDSTAPVAIVEGPPVPVPPGELEGLDAREALPPLSGDDALQAPAGAPRLMSWDEVSRWERRQVEALASDASRPAPPDLARFGEARAAAPGRWAWPDAPAETADLWDRLVAPAWPRWTEVVGRYLASRAHACWAMYLGDGPRDVEAHVARARAVLQVEAVRLCVRTGTPPDRLALREAIRRADLLLVHYADPAAFPYHGRP
jgi:Fe-S-cluster containining protein